MWIKELLGRPTTSRMEYKLTNRTEKVIPPTISSLGPVDHSYRCPTPPALIALEVTGNEVCVLFKCRRIATSIHGAQKRPPDQRDVLDPGILP
jgi:hypothetical protein